MKITRLLTGTLVAALCMGAYGLNALPVRAAATIEATFDNYNDLHIIKNNGKLFGFAVTANGDVEVYRRVSPQNWKLISGSANVIDLKSSLRSIDETFTFKGKQYIAGRNNDGTTELWRTEKSGNQPWTQVGGDGFGNSGNTQVVEMLTARNMLFAFVHNSNERSTRLYKSRNGKNWKQVGETGLGAGFTVTAAGVVNTGSGKYVVVAGSEESPSLTASVIYRASVNNLKEWERVGDITELFDLDMNDDEGALPVVYNIFNRGDKVNLVVSDVGLDNGVEVLSSSDGLSFTKLGETGLTAEANETWLGFAGKINGKTYAGGTKQMPTIYRYNAIANEWEVAYETGFDSGISTPDLGNNSIASSMKANGNMFFIPLYNATDETVSVGTIIR